MTLLAVLLAPISWSHAYLVALPVWVAALTTVREEPSPVRTAVLLVAGLAMSGVLTIWWRPLKLALLAGSICTWGGLLLLAVSLLDLIRARTPTGLVARAPAVP